MTIPSYTASGSFILFIPGLLFLLYGAWQAIRQRQNARRLILWGAVHDAGLICMALGAANAAAGTGVWLFVAFQLLARGLSWSPPLRRRPSRPCAGPSNSSPSMVPCSPSAS